MGERIYVGPENVEEVSIVWNENGYKRITVTTLDGKMYTVESDD